MTITAKEVRRLDGWKGDARLYELSELVAIDSWDDDEEAKDMTRHVVVSAVVADYTGPETFIFPADEDGNTKSFVEMDGSHKGTLSHADAIAAAGWVIV